MKFGGGSLGKFTRGRRHKGSIPPYVKSIILPIEECDNEFKLNFLKQEKLSKIKTIQEKQEKKKFLHEEQNGRCHYCRDEMILKQSTLDHVIPRSQGGEDNIGNLVLACYGCNQKKRDRLIAP